MDSFEIGRITNLCRCNNYMTVNSQENELKQQEQQRQQQQQSKMNINNSNNNKIMKTKNGDVSVALRWDANRRGPTGEPVSGSININLRLANFHQISTHLLPLALIEISQVWKSWRVLAKIRLHHKS